VLILPDSGCSNFFSSWDEGLSTLWIPPAFSVLSNMSQNNLVQPIAAAATSQVKLRPYDEEEPHIWFHLIEAQFAAAGRSQKLKYANALASLPKQVLRANSLFTRQARNAWLVIFQQVFSA
jgi:hypothetical protein